MHQVISIAFALFVIYLFIHWLADVFDNSDRNEEEIPEWWNGN